MSVEDRKKKLGDMLDALVKNKPEDAQIAFHDYLGDKMRPEVAPEVEDEPTPDEETKK